MHVTDYEKEGEKRTIQNLVGVRKMLLGGGMNKREHKARDYGKRSGLKGAESVREKKESGGGTGVLTVGGLTHTY